MFQSRKWARDSEAAQQFREGGKGRDTSSLAMQREWCSPLDCYQHLAIAGEGQGQSRYLDNAASAAYKLTKGICSSSVQRIPKVLCNHRYYFIHP